VVRILDTTKTKETLNEDLKGDFGKIKVSHISFITVKSG
jgi:hypothetical protein